uniref:LIM zinc-binding domain-containing protein n=1 Tax=Angiostrongylus cantonensis TaxID=6313 RepID=A0A158P6P4_ANGCA
MSDALVTNRQRFHSPSDFISEHLDRIMANDGQSFNRSTFEQRVVTGGSPAGSKPIENRGQNRLIEFGLMFRGAFVLAAGLTWCPEHFVCAYRGCGRRLLECGFVEEHGSKYCESCFEAHIAPRCAKCSKPIVADCLNAMQKKWHPTCFTCAHCRKPFGNTAFYLENGLAYCENDWNALFTTKCVACKYPIEAGDRWVEALGNAFHSNCFNCTVRKFPNTKMKVEIIMRMW